MDEIIDRACEASPGKTATSLASALGVSVQVISMWRSRRNIPARYWVGIQRVTGGKVSLAMLSNAAAERAAA